MSIPVAVQACGHEYLHLRAEGCLKCKAGMDEKHAVSVPDPRSGEDRRVIPERIRDSEGNERPNPLFKPKPDESQVDHPSHYNAGGIEVIDVIEAFGLDFNTGNAVKYLLRCGRKTKDKVTDLNKALWYARRALVNGERGADEVMEKAIKAAMEEGRKQGRYETTKKMVAAGFCPSCLVNKMPTTGGALCAICLNGEKK